MTLEIISRHPSGEARPTPLLFIHGAWHGAWCWDEHFLPYFAHRGYAAYALSLRGHGSSPATKPSGLHTIGDYVADVMQAADQITTAKGKRPVVIGHSMGGYVVQKYLERASAPAAVLLASIPVNGTLPLQFHLMRHHTVDFLKSLVWLNGWPLVAKLEMAHHHFFSNTMPVELVRRYHARMNGESIWILVDAGVLDRPNPSRIKAAPMLVLAAENDRVFSVREQHETAQAYRTTAQVFPNMAHDMMLEPGWEQVAAHIIEWLYGQGL